MGKEKHVFFREEDFANELQRQKAIESTMPDAYNERQKEVKRLKQEFLNRAQALKLGKKYSGEFLVLEVFGLRFEEGLKELLDRYTRYEQVGNDFIFTHVESLYPQ